MINPKLRAALVIARRDYVATVWSRAFLLFLIGPLFPIAFGVLFGQVGADMGRDAAPPLVAIIAPKPMADKIIAAHARLQTGMGDRIVDIQTVSPDGSEQDQVTHLLHEPGVVVVISGLPHNPVITGPSSAIAEFGRPASLILGDARRATAMDEAGIHLEPIRIIKHPVDRAAAVDLSARQSTARGGQLLLFVLIMILAGMLLSNLMEEKSNKVIEVLAAAVPVDAIFFGKLIAMLGMSLTGIAIWATGALIGLHHFKPEFWSSLAAPAVGWPIFVGLGVIYFMASYLLLGALFLTIGAHASTVREVQTLSMPITMGQLGVFGLASASVTEPAGHTAMLATLFPWSSPFTMMSRGAQLPELWPHVMAIVWQGCWIAVIILVGSRLFRRSVLKSGGGRKNLFRDIWRSGKAD